MKLNIVTGSSNSLGKTFLKHIANDDDVTIWISRRWCDMSNVINLKVDLLDKKETKKRLYDIFSTIDFKKISSIHIIHTAAKIKNELTGMEDPRYIALDLDKDGIDDEVFNCTYTTFNNIHDIVVEFLKDIGKWTLPKYINIIWTLLDKKNREPSSHKSMIKTNKLLRNYVLWLCEKDWTYKWVCVSVWTIATESELNHRKHWEHQYWLKESSVVSSILERNSVFVNEYSDVDLYVHNPRYEQYYKYETDEQMTERFKREIGLI